MPHETARALDRPIGRNGGMRDKIRHGRRSVYVTVALTPAILESIERETNERGLSVAAFLGMIVEGAFDLKRSKFDEMLAGIEKE
jgi:hypothetical protein